MYQVYPLINRYLSKTFYIGEIKWHGLSLVFKGKRKPITGWINWLEYKTTTWSKPLHG